MNGGSFIIYNKPPFNHTRVYVNEVTKKAPKMGDAGASLVVQWLRIRLPMQGTRVRVLVQEDPSCCGATKPVRHNYWACALEPVLHNKRSHRNEKPAHHNEEQPPLAATRESPRAATKTQCSHKSINQSMKWNEMILQIPGEGTLFYKRSWATLLSKWKKMEPDPKPTPYKKW